MDHFMDIGCGDGGCHPHLPETLYEVDRYNFEGIVNNFRRSFIILFIVKEIKKNKLHCIYLFIYYFTVDIWNGDEMWEEELTEEELTEEEDLMIWTLFVEEE